MKTMDVALCDSDVEYIMRFGSYLLEHTDVGIHIFTTPESYFADQQDFDAVLMTSEFDEISSFKKKESSGHKYLLWEEETEEPDHIFKYQSMEKVFNLVAEFRAAPVACESSGHHGGESRLMGIYSPINHELQLPFAMALCQTMRNQGRVLFLDLEEVSILPDLLSTDQELNLMDLLYDLQCQDQEPDLFKYTQSFMGFSYIAPFINANEISEIDEETWRRLFDLMERSAYDRIVILFGRSICGFKRALAGLNKLYVLGRPGDYFKKSQDAFMTYLTRAGIETPTEQVMLPMSASNLTEGCYCLQELLQGNLGAFVSRLEVGPQERNVMYG